MKTKLLSLLMMSGLIALAAWVVHVPTPVQADDIPEKYRETVSKGLEYLVKNQCDDGHWEGDDGQHPVAMTGLVGVALLMEKQNEANSRGAGPQAKYAAEIRKAARWLISKSQPGRDGLIFSDDPAETTRYMQGHGLATTFLAGASKYEGYPPDRKQIDGVVIRAVNYIVKAQSSQGGWYRTSKVEGHDFDTITDTVIQIQALLAAENRGIDFHPEVLNDAQEYLRTALGKHNEGKVEQKSGLAVETAGALSCRRASSRLGKTQLDEMGNKWLKLCQTTIPVGRDMQFGRDELSHYYYAQALFTIGGDAWATYRTAMFDQLQKSQNKDGSWPASAGIGVGRVYSTALWCVVLQLDKGSHPSRQPAIVAID